MTNIEFNMPIGQMSKSQQKIAAVIVKAPERIPYFTEEDIAAKAGVSIATVSRFWRSAGYESLKAFKKYLQETQQSTPARKMQQVLDKTEGDITREMIASAAVNLEETDALLDRVAFERAVETLHEAEVIYAHGPGASASLTELLRFRLNRLGADVRVMAQSGHELLEHLVHAGPGDVVLMFGFVRKSPEAAVILEQAAVSGYSTLLVTDMLVSDMLEASDIVLQVDRGDADVFHSLVAPLALVESLSVALARRGGEPAMGKLRELHALRRQYASLLPK